MSRMRVIRADVLCLVEWPQPLLDSIQRFETTPDVVGHRRFLVPEPDWLIMLLQWAPTLNQRRLTHCVTRPWADGRGHYTEEIWEQSDPEPLQEARDQ